MAAAAPCRGCLVRRLVALGRFVGVFERSRGRRPRRSAFDLVAQLDERQLTSGDLCREALSLLWVLDLHELVRVRERVFAQGHQLPNLRWSIGEAESILEVALVLAELLGKPTNGVAVLSNHAV